MNEKPNGSRDEEQAPADLLAAAKRAFGNAYAPYSRYRVGAALRGEDGRIWAGANVENASFGLTRCAEQSAVQALVSAGSRSFGEIVVYTESDEPASPCGACRQVLNEFAPGATIYLTNHRGVLRSARVADLLPGAFVGSQLPA